jgi:putative Mg2+ transporter-C (MgtC) family protein
MRFSDEAVLRLLVAVVLGALIGVEREQSDQPAGLRTHIAVCVGASLFGIVSTIGFKEFESIRASTNVQVDVTRVASQVVVGIGFLGAGIIFRQGTAVRNLTTAASLWVTSAIGLTCGVGDLGTAAVATAIMLVALVALLPIRNWLRRRIARPEQELRIRLATGTTPGRIIDLLHGLPDVRVDRAAVQKEDGHLVVIADIKGRPRTDLDELVGRISAHPDVLDLEERGARGT